MAVDMIARMMAMGNSGGSGDSYTKAETDALLDGKADLVDGKVPASQLPSYVDDVLEYASVSAFPATGESGKIYVATGTNKTYRWSGTGYAEISESLALGETASTAYAGNNGKANADAIAAIKDGTNIDSFADVETALADKADKSTTYTKGQVDTALAAKLNTADVDVSLSSTSTNPVQNKVIQAAISKTEAMTVSLLNRGAKNILPINDKVMESSGNIVSQSFLLEPGVYVFTATMSGTGSTQLKFTIGSSTGEQVATYTWSNSLGSVNHEYEISEQSTWVTMYTNAAVTYSNMMLCRKSDYEASPSYVPYAPTNRELYEMILALQNAQNGG